MAGSDDEIVVAITAQTAQLNEGVAQATATLEGMQAKVAAEAQAFNAATQLKIDAIGKLNSAFAGNLASVDGIAAAENALDQARQVGALSTTEYAARLNQLNAAEKAAAEAVAAEEAALEAQNAAMTVSGGVARELGVMVGEVMRGNYTRLEGSTITLANRTGLLSTAFQFLTSPAGLVATAIAAIGAVALEAMDDINNLRSAVISSGGASGNSVNQLREMAQALEQNGATARQAREAVMDVAQSGRMLGSSFQETASAAISMSELTGQSIEACVKQIARLADDPVKVLKDLNERFHFLTPAEAEQVKHLRDVGDTTGATAKAVSLLNGALMQYNQQLSQSGSGAQSFKERTESAFSSAWEDVKGLFQPRTIQAQLDTINDMLTQYGNRYKGSLSNGVNGSLNFNPNAEGLDTDTAQTMNRLLEERQELQAKIAADQQRQAQASQQEITNQKGVNEVLGASGQTKNLEDELHKQEAAQQISYDRRAQFESDFWQKVYETSQQGSAQQSEAWEHIQSSQRELDNQQLEDWRRTQTAKAEAARKAVQDVLNTFELERSEAQAASAQRIAIDAQLMDRLGQLEGTNTQHYREALNQRLADTRAFVAAVQDQQKKQADEAAAIYQKQNESAVKAVQELYAEREKEAQQELQLGRITSDQEIALLRQYAAQEYQTEMDILEHYRSLMVERPRVVQEINNQIAALQQQHNQRMQQIDQQALKQDQQLWQQRLRPITQAFDQSITGMIQGTQTMQQAWNRMLQSMLMSEIRNCAQFVSQWVASELAKTSATVAGNQAREMSTQAATRTGMAENAAMSQKQIFNAAYTAAANTYSSVSQIPYVGWIMAPIAAAGAFAAVEGFDQISSASGGWDRVPFDDAPALLHRNEMVLPAPLADRVRGMTGGGGGGDVHNWNINANDSKSFHQQLMSNPRMLAKAGKMAAKQARKGR